MKTKQSILKEQFKESAEAIMQNKWGWTDFTNWAKDRFECGAYKANKLWNGAWKEIHKTTEKGITYSKDAAFIELEQLKQQSAEAGDRRTYLDAVKYQGKINKLEDAETQININADNIKLSWGNNETKSEQTKQQTEH